MKKLRGMVLSAGLGKRLRPLTYLLAKPAVPFLGKPLLHYSLDLLSSLGIRDIAVNLHYLPHTVESALRERNENILLSREEAILGTGGCLAKLRRFFSGSTIVLSNGKIYFSDSCLEAALQEHSDKKSMVTMVLVPFRKGMPYKQVFLDDDHNILGFSRNISSEQELETISTGKTPVPFVFTGIQIIDSDVLPFIPDGYSDTVADIYPDLIRRGFQLRGHVSRGFWRECSTPGRYLQASIDAMRKASGESSGLPGGEADGIFTGDSVKIPDDTLVRDSVIWDNSRLGRSSVFEKVIIAGTTGTLPEGMRVRNAVITPRLASLSEPVPAGTEIGPDYMIWPILEPGK